MIRKILCSSTCIFVLFSLTATVNAGNLYRFKNENGVTTLSRSMPAEAAQRGYDILDDKTMRLLERIPPAPTADEIAEMEAEELREKERQIQEQIEAKQAEQARVKQARIDRSLLTSYSSEQDLIKARDKDLNYRKEQIELLESKLPDLEARLVSVQKDAAERELSGGKITDNMQKRLDAAHEAIAVRKAAIEEYQQELDLLSTKYEQELNRLRELLQARAN